MASVSLEMKSSEVVADLKLEQEQEQEQEEQHFHVLAVDDSLLDRKVLEKLLRGCSYQVTCVDSGDEALKYLGLVDELNHNSPTSSSIVPQPSSELEGTKVINLIMTDYCMPGMSGYDLLKRVKGSSWKDVPVVVMSSENVPSRISRCLEGGAEEFLLKPLQPSDLKKLHHYLLKSLHHYPGDSNNNNVIEANIEVGDIDQVDQVDQSKSSSENVVRDDSSNNNNIVSIISKRKAVSAQTMTERRPKMKGLAVV